MWNFFGTDGVRGKANHEPMTVETALKIGKAIACLFQDPQGKSSGRIIVGKDTRLSGDMIEHALIAGICSMGSHALRAGVIPTPAVSFLTVQEKADAGIMISASHNPYDDNGIKIFADHGRKLSDEGESVLENMLLANNFDSCLPPSDALGHVFRMDDAQRKYIDFLKETFLSEETLAGTKIVLDCAHGATFQIAPAVFRELGGDTITLFDNPNGININHECGSQHPKRLAEEIIRNKACCGFAFDGDGDRVIAVDEEGQVLTGDQMLAICARFMKEEGILANNLLVRTVMSNIGLTIALKELGIDYVLTDVGDRYVLEAMLDKGAVLGGEDSGHLLFLNHHAAGDGILSALQVMGIMKKRKKKLSELARIMTVYPQTLMNVETRSRPDLSTIPAVQRVIEDVEASLQDKGRVLVRYSGTQNLCRVMVEGPTPDETSLYCKQITDVIRAELG